VLSGLQGLPIGGLGGAGGGVGGLVGLQGLPSGSLVGAGGVVGGVSGVAATAAAPATSSAPTESATSATPPQLPANYTLESLYEWWLRVGKDSYGNGRVSWAGAPRSTFNKMKHFLTYLDTVVFSSSGSSSAAGVPMLVAGATPAANKALAAMLRFYEQQQHQREKGFKVTVFVTYVFMYAANPDVAAREPSKQQYKTMGAALCEAVVAAGLSPIKAAMLNKAHTI